MANDKPVVARTFTDHVVGYSSLQGKARNPITYLHRLSKQNDQAIAAIADEPSDVGHAAELRRACVPPLGSFLVLLDNDWNQCAIDAVRMAAEVLPGAMPMLWQGMSQVCPGRHLVVTALPSGAAVLDTLVHPGQMIAFRLDRSRAAWAPITGPEAESLTRATNARKLHFQDYFTWVGKTRLASGLAQPVEEMLEAVGAGFVHLVQRLDSGEPPASLAPDAMLMGRALFGLPLESFERIAEPIGAMAWQRSAAGRRDLARLVTQLGLAWLPGEPSLLASLAGLAADEGNWDEALGLAAQARVHANPKWTAWLDALCARAPRG